MGVPREHSIEAAPRPGATRPGSVHTALVTHHFALITSSLTTTGVRGLSTGAAGVARRLFGLGVRGNVC
jgi:hypothetical protein